MKKFCFNRKNPAGKSRIPYRKNMITGDFFPQNKKTEFQQYWKGISPIQYALQFLIIRQLCPENRLVTFISHLPAWAFLPKFNGIVPAPFTATA